MTVSDRIMATSSLGVVITAILPALSFPIASMPFGIAIIIHGIVFTICSMTLGWSPSAAFNVLALFVGTILHTATATALGDSSLQGYSIMLSGMAFACSLYEMQASIYAKTRRGESNPAAGDDEFEYTGIYRTLVTFTSIVMMPIVVLTVVTILGMALLLVLAPIF